MNLSGETKIVEKTFKKDYEKDYKNLLNDHVRLQNRNKKLHNKYNELLAQKNEPAKFDIKQYNILIKCWTLAQKYSRTKVKTWTHKVPKDLSQFKAGDNKMFLECKKYMGMI